MAVTIYQKPRWLRGLTSRVPVVDTIPEGSSQSATKAGQFVYRAASTGEATISTVSTGGIIWGILNQDATGTEKTSLEVTFIEGGDVIEISYDSAFTNPPVVGTSYDLVNGSSKANLINTTSHPMAVVLKIVNSDTSKPQRCEVRLLPSVYQTWGGTGPA